MQQRYSSNYSNRQRLSHRLPKSRHSFRSRIILILLIVALGLGVYAYFKPTPEKAAERLRFDASVGVDEQAAIKDAIKEQGKTFTGKTTAKAETVLSLDNATQAVGVYVPVTNKYAARQTITKGELGEVSALVSDEQALEGLSTALGVDVKPLTGQPADISESAIAFIPAAQLTPDVKLLGFEGSYYLDNFTSGAVFRKITFEGGGASALADLKLNSLPGKDQTFKIIQSGVTALTRRMMTKLDQVGDPKYFSKDIGAFLADADLTHVSNEVSFKPGCEYSNAVFCSSPEFIETLKASGVDLVELTGNHNNDTGRQYNTDTINQYHSLGWHTFGGGLNNAEAAKPYLADQKGSKVGFLAYNYPDSPNGGAISTASSAGANSFDFDKIESDIKKVKEQGAQLVIVDVQFWECYAYPEGYVEYPICDQPIPNQEEVFRKIIDLGADMMVGSSAHQPQTYEFYQNKPIYYGLGNLYFDQTQWPGTERGIILTHYVSGSKLLQTKLTPTVYDKAFQTRPMDNADAVSLLERLGNAREAAGL
jgi:poly-gamma-glutamate capsule biosynthesis protein CapA/YwtB (metallophosphatase superfamily)